MNDYILGTALGGLSAFFCSIPAIVSRIKARRAPTDLPLLVDVHTIYGRTVSARALFFLSLFLQGLLGSLFGLLYVVFVREGWLFVTHAPYTYLSLLVYAIGAWFVVGLVIFPAFGLGLFGRTQGERVWIEILASLLLIGHLMWLFTRLYQPMFFVV